MGFFPYTSFYCNPQTERLPWFLFAFLHGDGREAIRNELVRFPTNTVP